MSEMTGESPWSAAEVAEVDGGSGARGLVRQSRRPFPGGVGFPVGAMMPHTALLLPEGGEGGEDGEGGEGGGVGGCARRRGGRQRRAEGAGGAGGAGGEGGGSGGPGGLARGLAGDLAPREGPGEPREQLSA